MSGECGHRISQSPVGLELAKAATTTLSKLNSMMRKTSNWQEERLLLESNVHRLKSALQKDGKSPDEALAPDPMVVHQRSEINRLELTRDRLEEEVRNLRVALLEADQAITCSGARRLKEKMGKIREEAAEERGRLRDEIEHLKLRVQEAEESSSCSSLGRLRRKLREILNGDKKMECIIADVASRTCAIVIDLSNQLTNAKEILDESRVKNARLTGENKRLEDALRSASGSAMSSGSFKDLETIGPLGFRLGEIERRIKEVRDDSELVKRVGELEDALNENRKLLEDQEDVVVAMRNELLGAKTAYNIKSQEVDDLRDSIKVLQDLRETLKSQDKLVTDLRRRLELSDATVQSVKRLKNELIEVKSEMLKLEIERDGLLDETEKIKVIVEERNEQIVRILEENEERERTRRSEMEGMKTRLCIASLENEKMKFRYEDIEKELIKSNQASGDPDESLIKKIKELEEELVQLKRHSSVKCEMNILQESGMRLEKDMSEESVARFMERLDKFQTENILLRNEIDELKVRSLRLEEDLKGYERAKDGERLLVDVGTVVDELVESENQYAQTEDRFRDEIDKLETDNDASKLELVDLKAEYDTLKLEIKKLSFSNDELNNEVERSRAESEELMLKLMSFQRLTEKVEGIEEKLEEALEEADFLRRRKASLEILKVENEELKKSLKTEKQEKMDLVKSMQKLRSKVEEQSATRDEKNETQKLEVGLKTLVMDYGDYVRADKELKYYIHLQSLAVKRVVDFISYVDGTSSMKPDMATFLEPVVANLKTFHLDENVTKTFKMSQKLSEMIFETEINVQKLETIKNTNNHLKIERDCLNRGIEKLSKMLSKFGNEISTSIENYRCDTFENG